MIRTVVAALVLAACGSSHTPAAAPAQPQKAQMPPEVAKFHDAFEPHWEAPRGEQRTKDTCAAVPELKADADAIATATPPVGANADTWTTATKRLVGSVMALDQTCQTTDAEKLELALEGVHAAYDDLSAAAGATKM